MIETTSFLSKYITDSTTYIFYIFIHSSQQTIPIIIITTIQQVYQILVLKELLSLDQRCVDTYLDGD